MNLHEEISWRQSPLPGATFDGTQSNLRSEAKQVHTLMYNRASDTQKALLLKKKPDGATDGSYTQWITGKAPYCDVLVYVFGALYVCNR